jgi:hypothetical protein
MFDLRPIWNRSGAPPPEYLIMRLLESERRNSQMTKFKDLIPAGGGKVTYHFDASKGLAFEVSGFMRALYFVALSMDGRRILCTVPAGGIGHVSVYPQPSVLACVQSDEQGLWGRNCPHCEKYFRTNHIVQEITHCPYCAEVAPSIDFISKDQRVYLTACYDAFACAYRERKTASIGEENISDVKSAWHYSEVKQQFHFKCDTDKCGTETDILGDYGFCPQCGRTNARKLFKEEIDRMLTRWQETDRNIADRRARGEVWEDLTVKSLFAFEPFAKHVRLQLLLLPMTARRRKQIEEVSFQKPLAANESLMNWFDVGLLEWPGNATIPKRTIPPDEVVFIKKMVQRRHLLTHNRGIVDQEYLDVSGDASFALGERIRIRSAEAKRFLERVRDMGLNLLDNVEQGFHLVTQ